MTPPARTTILGLLTLLLLAAPASARTVPLDKKALSVSVAGERVSWLTGEAGNTVALHTIAPGAAAATTVATLTRHAPSGDAGYEVLATDAKSWTVALRDGRSVAVDPEGYVQELGDKVVSGTWTSAATTTRLDCAPPANTTDSDVPDLEVAYAATHLLIGGAACGGLTGLQDLAPAPAAAAQLAPPPKGSVDYGIVTHGAFAAYLAGTALVVRDMADGKTVTSVPINATSAPYAVDDDGTLVFARTIAAPKPDETISALAPGATTARILTGLVARPYILGEQDLVAGGGNVLYEPAPQNAKLGLALAPLAGGAPRVIGDAGAGAPRYPVAVDATNATFLSTSCSGVRQLSVVALAAPLSLPIGCPLSVDPAKLALSKRRHTATLTITCPNGCRTRVGLFIPLRQKGMGAYVDRHDDNALATARVSLASGATTTVTLHFAKLAQQFVKRAKGLKPYVLLDSTSVNPVELMQPVTFTLPATI